MGAYTFSQFKEYAKERMGGNDAWDARYPVWVNSAYRQLTSRDKVGSSRIEIPELETSSSATTVDGTAYVSVPSDCISIIEIFDETNDVNLSWTPFDEYISRTDRADTTKEDKPTYWVRSGAYIYLYPTPDSAYTLTIHYRKRPADLSGDSDVTVLGEEWDDVILELAVSIGRDWANEPEKAIYSRKLAESMAKDIMDIYNREEKARDESMRPATRWNQKKSY